LFAPHLALQERLDPPSRGAHDWTAKGDLGILSSCPPRGGKALSQARNRKHHNRMDKALRPTPFSWNEGRRTPFVLQIELIFFSKHPAGPRAFKSLKSRRGKTCVGAGPRPVAQAPWREVSKTRLTSDGLKHSRAHGGCLGIRWRRRTR
jgi:hypothetical protein